MNVAADASTRREIQYVGVFIFLLSFGIQVAWAIATVAGTRYYYDVILLPVWSFMSIFFTNSLLVNIVGLCVPGAWFEQDSVYYSTGTAAVAEQQRPYPTLTIQVPVYKESFAATIRPTLEQALEACRVYMSTTGAAANVLVNDDGLLAGIAEEEEQERRRFYADASGLLTMTARPAAGRRGRFKKAGNLNHGLAMAAGQVGDIILLLDSDSRIPVAKLSQAVREFDDGRVGFVQVCTRSMRGGGGAWETLIAHFTDNIYELSFVLVTGCGSPSPLVGHNAFLRRSAIDAAGPFSEEHVSEDFECSMRLQIGGWVGRYLREPRGFEEGVTLTVVDEIIRLQKYAYGVNELIMHPFGSWCSRGILGATFKAYMASDAVAAATKYNVLGYMGTWYALASTPFMATLHYFGYHYCPEWRGMYVTAETILYGCVAVFSVLTPISTVVMKWKMGLPVAVWKEVVFSAIYGIFFAGMGGHLAAAIASHMFGWRMSWTATNKEAAGRWANIRGLWRRDFAVGFGLAAGQIVLAVAGWIWLGCRDWRGIVPMAISAGSTVAVAAMAGL